MRSERLIQLARVIAYSDLVASEFRGKPKAVAADLAKHDVEAILDGSIPRGRRLTPEMVARIRSEYKPGRGGGYRRLARKYGVAETTIKAALVFRTHNGTDSNRAVGTRVHGSTWRGRARLTKEIVRAIRREYASGRLGLTLLARKYRAARGTIEAIVKNVTWKHVLLEAGNE